MNKIVTTTRAGLFFLGMFGWHAGHLMHLPIAAWSWWQLSDVAILVLTGAFAVTECRVRQREGDV